MRRRSMMQVRLATIASVVVMACVEMTAVRAQAVVIDDFSDSLATKRPESAEQRNKGSRKTKDRGLKGVVGGSREVTVNIDSGPSAATTATVWVDPSAGRLNYANSIGAKGWFETRYDADGRGFGQEFANASVVRIDVEGDVSAVPYKVTLTAIDRLGKTAGASRQVTLAGVQRVEIPVKELGDVNVKRLVSIAIGINCGASGDVEIRRIETVDSK